MNWNRVMPLLLALCVMFASVTLAGAESLELNEQLLDDTVQIELPEDEQVLELKLDDAGADLDDLALEVGDDLALSDDIRQEDLWIELTDETVEMSDETAAAKPEANVEEDVPIDETHFPDSEFRDYYVRIYFDRNNDGILSIDEINSITEISLNKRHIYSVQGIEYFKNLKKLECTYCSIKSLDVSKCASLTSLDCSGNLLTSLIVGQCQKLTSLECWDNQLVDLDVSGCPNIEEIACGGNLIEHLNLNGCLKLTTLDCHSNQIRDLNVRSCESLVTLWCADLKCSTLDFSDCVNLEDLVCGSDQLEHLNVLGCQSLKQLWCEKSQLKSLDVTTCQNLYSLNCSENKLNVLNVKGCANLQFLLCSDNLLKSLDLSDCAKLKRLFCHDNLLSELNVSNCPDIDYLDCSGNELTSLIVNNCVMLNNLFCYHNSLKSLDVSECPYLIKHIEKGTLVKDNSDYWAYYTYTAYYSPTDFKGDAIKIDKDLTIYTKKPELPILNVKNVIILGVEETASLIAADSPVPASDCSFGSYNPDVAEVDGNGVITGRRVGKTTITVTTNRGVKATCKVQVKKAPTSIELSKSKLMLGKGEAYQLTAKLSKGSAGRITWSCNKKKVSLVADADVLNTSVCSVVGKNTTVTTTEVIVTARTYNGLEATCTVAVYKAPSAVWLSHEKLTMGVGEPFTLKAENIVGYSNLAWSSSKPKIVSVDANGKIKALKQGTAKITVKTFNGKKATCEVTVKAKPTSIKLDKKTLKMRPYDTYVLTPTLSRNSGAIIKWKSSNNSVATVDENGMVTSLKEGSATITAYTWNKKKAKCKVEVAPNSDVKYRALLIGQEKTYEAGDEPNFRKDAEAMTKLLKGIGAMPMIVGPAGGEWSVTTKYDVESSEMVLSLIGDTFSGADSNDVSLFFISCHGDEGTDKSKAGQLQITNKGESDYLKLSALASTLKKVPGKVIVILASCGSGAGIYANNGAQADASKWVKRAKAFNRAAIDAFADEDDGLYIDRQGNAVDVGDVRSNTGELRKENKFYVLTACDYGEEAYFVKYKVRSRNRSTYFVSALTYGVGGLNTPADSNRDKVITLEELYSYTSRITKGKAAKKSKVQNVQVYPKNCGFGLFKLN